jgi:N-acyl homoserine lactone hydrolase
MSLNDPIRRVSVVSTGAVQIRPDHVSSTWRPMFLWLLTSRQWTGPRPINAFVIEHRDGVVLFDTGQDRASVTEPDYFPGGIAKVLYDRLARFEISPEETLSAGLDRLGYAAGDVHTAVLSHLHQDHIGGLGELGQADIVVSQTEWDTLSGPLPQMRGLMTRHIDLPGLRWKRIQPAPCDEPSLSHFAGSYDLFGDGSLMLLPTPGHTPGSMSLLVRQARQPPLMMVGDLTYDVHVFEDGHVPGVGSRRRLRAASAMVKTMRQQMPDLVILPAHDPGAADRLAQATGSTPSTPRQLSVKSPTRSSTHQNQSTLGDEMVINTLEEAHAGDTTQWIRVRGEKASNPVLLLIQQGPGLPMINEVRRFERILGLAQDFTVVYWDQRGCGRSLRDAKARADISVKRMVSDTVSLLESLRDRFGAKTYVAGFSLGATIGAYAAAQRPDLVATLVAVGMDIDGVAASNSAYDFALGSARQRGNKRATRQLEAIGPPPHLKTKQFSTRVRWASNFGGVTRNETYGTVVRGLLISLFFSSDYSNGDVIRTVRGITATQAALLPELAEMDMVRSLPHLDVPVVMVQGRQDKVAPGEAAQRYFSSLEAPSKQLVWFENSAHTPHLEEPVKFRDLLTRVRAGQLATRT